MQLEPVTVFEDTEPIRSLAWKPTGEQLAIASGKTVKILHTTTHQVIHTLECDTFGVFSVASG